jgi:hypothetical protein
MKIDQNNKYTCFPAFQKDFCTLAGMFFDLVPTLSIFLTAVECGSVTLKYGSLSLTYGSDSDSGSGSLVFSVADTKPKNMF